MREQDKPTFQIATIDPTTIVGPDGTIRLPAPTPAHPADAAQLWALAEAISADQLWIHPHLTAALGLPIPPLHVDGIIEHQFLTPRAGVTFNPAGLAPWVRMSHPRHETIGLALPTRANGGQLDAWCSTVDAEQLWHALQRFQDTLGWGWRSSAGWTSTTLLQHLYRRGGPGPSDPPPITDTEQPIVWTRLLRSAETHDTYVHVYDANSQYLPAAASVKLGTGTPEHVQGPQQMDPRCPGWWLATIGAPNRPTLPDPFHPDPRKTGPRWVTTPTLALALEQNTCFTVHEAWVWRSQRRWLRGWAERLRDARNQLDGTGVAADRIALAAIKATYKVGLGWLATDRRRGDTLHRPDWEATVRSKARANLMRRLGKLRYPPFAVDVDALWFLSASPDPYAHALDIGLPVGRALGQFKVVRSFPKALLADVPLGSPPAMRTLRQITKEA